MCDFKNCSDRYFVCDEKSREGRARKNKRIRNVVSHCILLFNDVFKAC